MTAIDAAPRAFLTPLFAVAAGVAVANLYYAQPLLGAISASLGLPPAAAGFSMTVMQVGYGVGMLLVVPLGDRFENRSLIVTAFAVAAAALLCAGLARSAPVFLAAAFCCGVAASVAQVIVPFASSLADPGARGRTVGIVMSGLLLGQMLARPFASLIADAFGWRAIFLLSSGLVALMALALARFVPGLPAQGGFRYRQLFTSMRHLFMSNPMLRRRAFVQFFLFGAFTLFWTAVPMHLMGPAFGLSQAGVAVFALVGVLGAGVAPLVGRAADRGFARLGAIVALSASGAAFLFGLPGTGGGLWALALLLVAATLIDCGVAASLIISQRAVLALGDAARSRLNGLFFFIFYSGGAVGSAVGAWAFVTGGWPLVCAIGLAMALMATLIHATSPKGLRP